MLRRLTSIPSRSALILSHFRPPPTTAVGLDLMQSEIAQALGFECSSAYWAGNDEDRLQIGHSTAEGSAVADDSPAPVKSSISSGLAKEWLELSQEIQGEYWIEVPPSLHDVAARRHRFNRKISHM
jgi:hypothetical protein